MTVDRPRTLGELAASGYRIESVKDEMRRNLIAMLPSGEPLFPGILGYDETVVPQVQNAILSKHDILFLGLRGQAKTRMLRELVRLLDDAIPIVAGSEIHDNPFAPVSKHARDLIAVAGRRHADRVDRPRRPLSRKAGHAGCHDRRLDRRGRHDQARRGALSLERADDALRTDSPGEPGNLLHQRAARSGTQDPGRACSTCSKSATFRFAGIRCVWIWISAWSSRPTPRTTPTAGGSSRRSRTGSGRSFARIIRSRARSGWRSATRTRGSTAMTTASRQLLDSDFHQGAGRGGGAAGPHVAAREPAVGRFGADVDRQPGKRRLERRAAGDHPSASDGSCPGRRTWRSPCRARAASSS